MRYTPADLKSFRSARSAALGRLLSSGKTTARPAPRVCLPPLAETYIARLADKLPRAEPADGLSAAPWPRRIHKVEVLLGQVLGWFITFAVVDVLI